MSGHTAAAGGALRGEQTINLIVERSRTWTPLQKMLRAMSWLGGRVELYQPIDAPEVLNESWPLVRQCNGLVRAFLRWQGPPHVPKSRKARGERVAIEVSPRCR